MNIFNSKLKLLRGTRFVSFLFIGSSVLIAAGILWAANMYYNIDTGEVVVEEIKRITGVLRATGGAIVGGTPSQNPAAGYGFQVATSSLFSSGDVVLSEAAQLLRFTGGTNYYVGFRATTTLSATTVYTWPATYPAGNDYVLSSNTGGVMSWLSPGEAGLGDILAVGDCLSGECFTSTATSSALWFYNSGFRAQLTPTTLTANRTINLPNAGGTITLGTGSANYVAYWTGANTLAGEAQLATSRGGTGQNTSAWSGMVKVVGGTWATTTGTANYAAYWSDANTVAAEQHLALSRGGTGAGLTAAAGGIVYSGASALAISAVGSANQILTSGGAAAPTWQNIANLITATNGLTETGTTALTLKLGGTLTETTTLTVPSTYNLIVNLTGSGDFKVQDAGSDIFVVTDDDRVLFKTYPIAQTGKEVLREMIPIFGFDLPAQTATTNYVKLSRTIDAYPFSPAETGASRVHRFVIRYTDNLPLASSTDWRVSTTTGQTYSSFTLPGRNNSALDSGWATTTGPVAIPTDGTDWWLEVKSQPPYDNNKIKVFQIFLAAYDQIQ